MLRVAPPLKKLRNVAGAALILLAATACGASADPCVQGCRGQHNECRMAAKLLSSARCDDMLMSCISRCFAGGRRDLRDGPRDMGPREFDRPRGFDRPREFDRPRGVGGPRSFGGPFGMYGGPRGWR